MNQQYRNERSLRHQSDEELSTQVTKNLILQDQKHQAEMELIDASSDARITKSKLREAELKIKKLEEEKLKYEQLLCKPMHEIAQAHGKFRQTYEEQQLLIGEWIVSQKAFKELAIQFGFEQGKKPEEVIEEGKKKKIDVILDKNNPKHNTNSDDEFFKPLKQKLKDKIDKRD